MNSLAHTCLLASILIGAAGAQPISKPVLKKGVSVQMAAANHAVMMRAADELDAVVVAITASGEIYLGAERSDPGALAKLTPETVYLKADSRAPYQTVLTVLDALRGKSVGLLTTAPANAQRSDIMPPYGIKLAVPK